MTKQNIKHIELQNFKLYGKREEYEKGFRMDEIFPLSISGSKTHSKPILSIVFAMQKSTVGFRYDIVSRLLADVISPEMGENLIIFPLYRYSESNTQQTTAHHSPLLESLSPNFGNSEKTRVPNLNPGIAEQIAVNLGLSFVPEKESEGTVCFINNPEVRDDFKTTFTPIDLLDYIYAVLHSPNYQEKYDEFLKVDFPRVPYPKAEREAAFWQLVRLGGELRQIPTETNRLMKEIDKIEV